MSLADKRLLVTGASGNLGKAVVAELRRLGAKKVIAATRTPGKHQELAALGVEEREADFDRPETLPADSKIRRTADAVTLAELVDAEGCPGGNVGRSAAFRTEH